MCFGKLFFYHEIIVQIKWTEHLGKFTFIPTYTSYEEISFYFSFTCNEQNKCHIIFDLLFMTIFVHTQMQFLQIFSYLDIVDMCNSP